MASTSVGYKGTQRRHDYHSGSIEEEAGAQLLSGRSSSANCRPFNIQEFAGLAFFAAMDLYKNKDVSMAFAMVLERALYLEYEASPEERLHLAESRHRKHLNHVCPARPRLAQQQEIQTQEQLRNGKTGPSATLNADSGGQTGHHRQDSANDTETKRGVMPTHSVDAGTDDVKNFSKANKRSLEDSTQTQAARSRQREAKNETPKMGMKQATSGRSNSEPANSNKRRKKDEVFSNSSLEPGMVVLLRTEADEDESWSKCWSLGRVLKISSGRRTLDVAWLKPISGATLPADKIFGRRWVPWTYKDGNRTRDWTSLQLSLASVQYGTAFPKNGNFSIEEQDTLANEVKRLEVLEAKSR